MLTLESHPTSPWRIMSNTVFSFLLLLLTQIQSLVGALSPISVKGTKLYDGDGEQFFIKGIAYGNLDGGRLDPLQDTAQCQIDAGLMKTLGVNTIRVYNVFGSQGHDGCMQAFASQGIYVWLNLPNPDQAMNRINPEWTTALYNKWSGTVDAFSGYDNILGFNIGDEVITEEKNTTLAAPYVKAAIRDIKAFRNARGYRPIPISYAAADQTAFRNLTAKYFACDVGDATKDAVDATIDMFGMNVYSWCDNSSYYVSGYDKLYEQFQDFNIPVVISETGCLSKNGPRDFAAVSAMLGPVFQAVFSGSVVYMWAMEVNGYGIVSYPNSQHTGFPSTLVDYNILSTVFAQNNPFGTASTLYTPSNTPPACPTSDSSRGWLVNPRDALPTIAGLEVSTITARTTMTGGAPKATGTGVNSNGGGTGGNSPDGNNSDGNNSATNTGLGAGAIAGIVVGCIAILVLGALGACLFIRRRRKTRLVELDGKTEHGSHHNGSQQAARSELPALSMGQVATRQEMPALSVGQVASRQEMDALQQPGYGAVFATQMHDELKASEGNEFGNEQGQVYYEMDGGAPGLPVNHQQHQLSTGGHES